MAKSSQKRRSSSSTRKPFTRGCCLSGCLCYLGCASVLLICVSLLGITLIAHYFAQIAPTMVSGLSHVTALLAVNSLPIFGMVIGIVELLQIRAVWQGYRWGVYGLTGIVISQFVLATWGARSPGDYIHGAMSIAYKNIPLIVLFLLIRAKWKEMQ